MANIISENNLSIISEEFNYKFKNLELLKLALTHSTKLKLDNFSTNERLEFLGDRVLGLVIANEIYNRFPLESEGELAKRFSELVSKKTLIKVAKKIHLEKFIITKSLQNKKKTITDSILADTLEAIFAAIFIDSNFLITQKIIIELWNLEIIKQKIPPMNPKSVIQEWCLKNKGPFPKYNLLKKKGPDHQPLFTVSLTIKNILSTNGKGKSIQEAEFMAAKKAIKSLIK